MRSLGKYQILEKIGMGGFGEVFKGYDPFIKRHVAVKTCTTDDTEVRTRFFQEAEIAGNLHHKNITTVYDFGVHEDLPYLIQEFLSGEDLDRKIKRRDYLPYPEKLYYLLQIARGLAHAHEQGVIHRDVKPANIRILEDGTVKIMDFGIAKLAQQETGLTKTGMTVGTASYLAPEQIRGQPVTLATDVFSFGVLAYELLCYKRPFQGEQISAVLYQTLHESPVPLRQHWPNVPPQMEAILDRALAKPHEARFQDAGDLLRHLEAHQRRGRGDAMGTGELDATGSRFDGTGDFDRPVGGLDGTRGGLDGSGGFNGAGFGTPTTLLPQTPPRADEGTGPSIDQIELSATAHQSTAAGAPPSSPTPTRETTTSFLAANRASIAALVAVALVAGGIGWWMARGERRAADVLLPTEDVADVGTSEGAATRPAASAGETTVPDLEPTVELPTEDHEPDPGDEGDAEETAPLPTVEETEGVVVLSAPAWTRGLRVAVGGETYLLDASREVRLEPGRHQAVFTYRSGDYSARETRSVTVDAGGRATLAPPDLRPAGLTARARPGRAQGSVYLDGDEVAAKTPFQGLERAPGTYRLEIRPLADDLQPLTHELELRPGEDAIVTFDLAAGEVNVSHRSR